jgi:hypothetical protein
MYTISIVLIVVSNEKSTIVILVQPGSKEVCADEEQ